MNDRVTLMVSSLAAITLFSLHWADEVARGLEPGTTDALGGFVILTTWLSATLVFPERRTGVILMFLGALLAAGVPVLHMQGKGWVQGRYATNAHMFFWVWTNIALGATGMLSLVVATRVLWRMRRRRRSDASAMVGRADLGTGRC